MDVGLDFLKLFHSARATQAADAALLEAALFEAVVDRCPGIRPDGSGLDLTGDAVRPRNILRKDPRGETEFGGVRPTDGVHLIIEYLERQNGSEHFLLNQRSAEVIDLEQARPVEC
jgi:hypothetical protein